MNGKSNIEPCAPADMNRFETVGAMVSDTGAALKNGDDAFAKATDWNSFGGYTEDLE